MNHIIRKTALILAFLLFCINYQGFAAGAGQSGSNTGGNQANNDPKTEELIKNLKGTIAQYKPPLPSPPVETPPPQPPNPTRSVTAAEARIPVTTEIVEYLLKEDRKAQEDRKSNDLKFYLSKSFTLRIQEQNETAGIKVEGNMIMLGPDNSTNEITIPFNKDNSEGILIEILGPDKGSEVKIFFQKEYKTLVFRRDKLRNGYMLNSVIINAKKPYRIDPSEDIQLYVSGRDNREAEVKVAAIDFKYPAPKPQAPNYQVYQTSQNANVGYNAESYMPGMPSRFIIGRGSLRPEGVIKYAEKRKGSALTKNDMAIVYEYFKEAESEGVNVDIAIAQMLHVTESFRSKQVLSTRNYAGLKNVPPKFTGSFDSMTTGVRAHIQHLKAYANETPRLQIVDPRYKLAFERGFHGMNFDQLYRYWSDRPQYGPNIDKILHDLYEY